MCVILTIWFIIFYHRLLVFLKNDVKPKTKEIWQFIKEMFLNWEFALCYFIAWAIIHVPILLGITLGLYFDLKWLSTISTTIYGILWLPFCNESIIQIPMALWLKKAIFSKDTSKCDKLIEKIKKR